MNDHIVTDAKSVVGFTHGHNGHSNGGVFQQAYGISDKDQCFATSVDAGEQTRDILSAIYSGVVATEKTGAANSLATEKVGAAGVLESVRGAQVVQVQAERIRADQAAQLDRHQLDNVSMLSNIRLEQQKQSCDVLAAIAACCCDIKVHIAEVNATILSTDAHRIRDNLAEARAELLALRSAGGHGNGRA